MNDAAPISSDCSVCGAVPAAVPHDEDHRIGKLLSYQVLGTAPETAYDDLAAIAAHICNTPTALVSLVDVSRQWFKSTIGLDAKETPRDLAFCAHAILQPDIMVIPDARLDERFANNPLVTGPPFIRFYAGAPLRTPEGHAVGTLCVIDYKPKTLQPSQIQALAALARQVVSQLEMRLTLQQAQQEMRNRQVAERQLIEVNAQLEATVEQRTAQLAQQNKTLEQALFDLKRTQTQLVHSEKIASLGELIAGITHEIKNPLCFVSGNVTHAKNYVADLLALIELYQAQPIDPVALDERLEEINFDFLVEDLQKVLSSMKIGTERMANIINSMRNFARTSEIGFKQANIHEGIDSTLMLLGHRLKAVGPHSRTVVVVRDYGYSGNVACDIGQLNQVFMNVLGNAIDALEVATAKPPQLTICTSQVAEHVSIKISDNGPGMSPAVLENIFKPFFTTKPTEKGTGIGLSISHKIVTEHHKGQISCQSEPGTGTTFEIKIPLNLA